MADPEIEQLYRAVAGRELDRLLRSAPALVSRDVVAGIRRDLADALAVRDVGAAKLALQTAAEIMRRLDDPIGAGEFHLDLLLLRLESPAPADDLGRLRSDALAQGAETVRLGWAVGTSVCWYVAAECAHRLSTQVRPPARQLHLLDALRDLADLLELVAAQSPGARNRPLLARLVPLLVAVVRDVCRVQWPYEVRLGLKALLSRVARASERCITRGLTTEIYADPQAARTADELVIGLFEMYG